MVPFAALVRRIVAEAERQVRGGVDLLVGLGGDRERVAELERLLGAYGERVRRLEEALHGQDAGLRRVRQNVEALVRELNERLLPRLDERMDDAERDVAALAAGVIRNGKDAAETAGRLDEAERRIGSLRTQLAQIEQRAGLWRDLQANLARLGEDVDALRAGLRGVPARPAEPLAEAAQEPASAP
ncbi:hypothetical protein [Actinomadura parmotrematis]|uniref:Uncharacterized protein n=1 Tax=Actinomadura parmotrematis TaxID=2864039 RepID=A0ABS7FYV1_9ACTN|nr:hypothetical protein [Actinomadura parmotrematis]MBW8485623.1 hypothetical protein [Actinomadura parmotrematis]